MTGRGAGFCAGAGVPGFANGGGLRGGGVHGGRGGGFGGGGFGGGGRGYRNQYWATGLTGWQRGPIGPAAWRYGDDPLAAPSKETEAAWLRMQASQYENGLAEVRARLSKLEGEES
jgi:hypothetical protein